MNYYDAKGRLLCSVNDNHLQGRTNRFFKYNFSGEVSEESVSHTMDGQNAIVTRSRYTYDHTGRKLQELYKVGNNPEFIARAYEYNASGDLINTYLYSPDGGRTFAQKLKYRYNIRGWMKSLNDFENPGFDLFALRLAYENPNPNLMAAARYNGNISQMCSNGRYATPYGFALSYDGHDRLIGSSYAEGTDLRQNQDTYTEDYGYDSNGNLLFLGRVCEGDYIDVLYYNYYPGTNRIESIRDNAQIVGGYNEHHHPYNYDWNGNPIYDPSRHATIFYNRLNLPVAVKFSPNDRICYSYTSTGKKLRKEIIASATPQNLTIDYCDEFLYEDRELKCIFAPFGRMRLMETGNGTQWRFYYSLTDHLGNVRAEFAVHDSGQPELVQQADYYPFGFTLRRDDYGSQLPNRRLYGGKELQDETLAGNTLDWYDFEARMYDPVIGRFLTTDPMAEKYYNLTPYEYCVNNPLRFIDPSGKTIVIGGDENASNEAFKQLQSSTSLILSKNKEGEVIIEGGKAKFFRDKLLMKAINDKSVIVIVDAIDGNSDDRTIGGSFMGNEIIETPISLFASKPFSELLSSSFRTVNTYQRVDPFETAILDDIGFLNEMGGEKAYRGQTMMHEVTESYIGGLNALKTGKQAGNASVSRQEFEEAHKAATLQPVLPDIEQILEEFRIRRGK